MPIERFCTFEDCAGDQNCKNAWRDVMRPCVYEYVRAPEDSPDAKFNWNGEGPPPRRWWAPDGTLVYRSYSDYCD